MTTSRRDRVLRTNYNWTSVEAFLKISETDTARLPVWPLDKRIAYNEDTDDFYYVKTGEIYELTVDDRAAQDWIVYRQTK